MRIMSGFREKTSGEATGRRRRDKICRAQAQLMRKKAYASRRELEMDLGARSSDYLWSLMSSAERAAAFTRCVKGSSSPSPRETDGA